ncbi:MAG: hypothetical protein AAGH73_04525 [Pseudomonadota bacterium]
MMMPTAPVLALMIVSASALVLAAEEAAERFPLPEGCKAFVTVQYKLCKVSHYYTCTGDPEGYQHRVDLDNEGPYFVSTIDDETQWIESRDLRAGILDRLRDGARDPASFTELTRTGRDDFDFTTGSDVGEVIRYRGTDSLTGETVIIDDVPLLRTETFARATREDGSLVYESRGNEYVHLDWRLFLGGQSVTRTPERTYQDDDAPMSFHFPGEAGFLAWEPAFNCDALLL